MAFRVALLGIYHESNTFIGRMTVSDDFSASHWFWGEAIRQEYGQAHHEIGGMLEVMDEAGVDLVPVMFAEATPGGMVSAACYRELLNGMIRELSACLPLDGCLVVPHGAAVSEEEADMDGHWLERVREVLGESVPIVGTLDLHANISQRMADATDALVIYKRNPHLDQRERGREAASLLLRHLKGEINPKQYLIQLPLAISIEQQFTDVDPCKSLYEQANQLEQKEGVLSVGVALGFPYADVQEMGTSVVVVTDGDVTQGANVAEAVQRWTFHNRYRFVGEKTGIRDTLTRLRSAEKPSLLLDMGDNIGGGTPGDGLALCMALEREGLYRYFSYQPDAAAVNAVRNIVVGTDFDLRLSGHDESGSVTWTVPATLVSRVNGRFTEKTPKHGGQAGFDMGETLIVTTAGGGTLMVSALRIPPFSPAQMTAFGLDPAAFDVIVAKGVNAPIAAYGPFCRTVFQVDTPGPSRADMTKLIYTNRRKPLFPFEVT